MWSGSAEYFEQEGERFEGALMAGVNHRHQEALCPAPPSAVAAPDFAIDDRRTDRTLGPMIRGLNCRIDQEPEPLHRVLAEMVGQPGTILMLLGMLDDRRGLAWQVRLLIQFLVAGVCVWLVKNLQLTAFLPAPLFTEALTVLWIVALINSFNMLDNMDALSGDVAAISAAVLVAVMLLAPNPEGAHRC